MSDSKKKYVVDPKGNLFELSAFGVVKPGWRAATQADIKARDERNRPPKPVAEPVVPERKPDQK